jgi:hypothetical protein
MKSSRLLCAAALALGLSGTADAAGLVLRSAGPSAKAYPAGRPLPDNASVSLRAGDMVTVLVSATTRVLRGPGTFSLAAGQRAAAAGFNPRARFGAMRAGEIPSSPSLWHVDVSQSGTFCVPAGQPIQLWRPESADAATLSISPAGGAEQKLAWTAGQDSLGWPSGIPLKPGAEYRLTIDGSAEAAKLSFADIGALPDDPAAMAKAFIDKGCQSQLDLFIDNIPGE